MSNQEGAGEGRGTFYITTPIYYPSDNPHIGHTYTTVAADAITRYKKLRGFDAYFLTGTDEHGQKIQRRAEEANKSPKAFVDAIVEKFQNLWHTLMIDYDDFIRTTDERHVNAVTKLFEKIYESGDIYKSRYEGWYCTPCESFFTDRQAGERHLCPDCARPLELMQEESYFFKMSKYADRWLRFIEENPSFIRPESCRHEMVNFVKQGLEDLCVSRTTFDWGIKLPFDQKHVVYVWFDALANYISALNYAGDDDALYKKYWPADIHLVGKDIARFHTIIWPIMLMSAGLPLPGEVLSHGWILIDGSKMSKSVGNVIDPVELVRKYGVDAVRYFLLRELPYGLDANYSEELLINRINNDLANDYGNLLSRATSMVTKFQNGEVLAPGKPRPTDSFLTDLLRSMPGIVEDFYDRFELANGLTAVWQLIGAANKYIEESAPWALNKSGDRESLATVLYNLMEVLRQVTILISPVMPNIPEKVWEQLGMSGMPELKTWDSLRRGSFPPNTQIKRGDALFPRIEISAHGDSAAETELSSEAKSDFPELLPEISIDDFARMDLRVATVLSCERVPKSEKLLKFVLKVANEERVVVSGIAKHYAPEELVGKNLILIANLKPAKIFGIESKGMLLSAVQGEYLEVLSVPSLPGGAKVR